MARFGQDAETTVSPGVQIKGTVRGAESLVVLGRIEGTIELDGALVIDAVGVVRATVHAERVTVAGVLIGDVTAAERIELLDGARVVGNLKAPIIRVDAKARLSGELDIGPDARTASRLPHPAPIDEPTPPPPPRAEPARTTFQAPPSVSEERRKKRVVIKKRR